MQKIDFAKIRVIIGTGEASFPMTRGSFKYKDKLLYLEELTTRFMESGETSESGKNREIAGEKQILEYDLLDGSRSPAGRMFVEQIGNEYEIRFTFLREGLNRFWITYPDNQSRHFYGCGETFSKFDLKGEKVRIWVAEHQNSDRISKKILSWKIAGKRPHKKLPFSSYESYYVQPTFISDKKYYVHVDGTSYMEMNFKQEGYVSIHMRENALIRIGFAPSFEKLSGMISARLGLQPPLPDWIYDGAVLGIQTGNECVEQKLKRAEEAGLPVVGVWCQDWSGCRRTKFGYQVMWNWEAEAELYPDLKERCEEWRARGVRFLGYINPFMAIEKELYRYASAHGYCVKDREGKDYLVTITTFPAAMIDLTNPEAYAWYKKVIQENMIDIGMAGWMADFGEYLPVDAVLYSGESAELLHNRWPALWAKLNYEAVHERGMEKEIVFFTRAGYTETIRYSPLMWNGDQHVDWSLDDGLASVVPATLSLAMSGFGITHSDVGGYTTIMQMTRSRELLMRWEEMNAFSPVMRSHEGNQPSRNVQFDDDKELLEHFAKMTRLHVGLKSYLKEAVLLCSRSGIPVMRPLFYHYEESRAYRESYEYLLGRDILVAPVYDEGAVSREVYLPNDRWVHLFTGKIYHGGLHQIDAPIGQPPVFVRESSSYRDVILRLGRADS